MANETEYSNAITSALIAADVAEYLRDNSVMIGKGRPVPFQRGVSDQVKLRQAGSVTATTSTESTAHAKSEYTQSSPATLQVAEAKVYMELSDRARDFSPLTVQELVSEAGAAIVDKVDVDGLALASGFSTSVGSTGVDLTADVLRLATYNLRLAKVKGAPLIILHPTQISDVQADIISSSGAVWGGPNVQLSILNGRTPGAGSGYVGSFLEVDVFSSTNTESINSDVDWAGLCLDPRRALAFGVDAQGIRVKIDETSKIQEGLTGISVAMYYDWKEADNAAGVQIISDQ